MIAARLWMSGGGYITYEGHERFREFLMLVVISPAKKLDMSVDDRAPTTSPDFAADAMTLAGVARELSHDDLRALMSISPAL
ncbi:MAG: peroxide stress protein YaaA, partial [Candidatus Puniceispirillaceae bacterium]